MRNASITKPNQAWSIDITYIRLKHGFVYLTAIIDWHSRFIVGWEIDDTLSATMVKCALENAFAFAKPQIFNSDQGSQFTGHEYIVLVESNKVKKRMYLPEGICYHGRDRTRFKTCQVCISFDCSYIKFNFNFNYIYPE